MTKADEFKIDLEKLLHEYGAQLVIDINHSNDVDLEVDFGEGEHHYIFSQEFGFKPTPYPEDIS